MRLRDFRRATHNVHDKRKAPLRWRGFPEMRYARPALATVLPALATLLPALAAMLAALARMLRLLAGLLTAALLLAGLLTAALLLARLVLPALLFLVRVLRILGHHMLHGARPWTNNVASATAFRFTPTATRRTLCREGVAIVTAQWQTTVIVKAFERQTTAFE